MCRLSPGEAVQCADSSNNKRKGLYLLADQPVNFPRGPVLEMGTWKGSMGANRVPQGHPKAHPFQHY